jgi:integrase
VSPRRRSERKRDWPRNLYEDGGYYSWRNPDTGEHLGIGRDKQEAFAEANEANMHIAGLLHKERLVDRLAGDKTRSVGAWLAKYDEILAERDLAENTRRSYKSRSKRAGALLGLNTKVKSVTALQVSEGLEAIAKSGKARLAQQLASWMRECFREAVVKGWLEENPVRDVKPAKVTVHRARLTLDVFLAVYRATSHAWLRNAMALAIVSGQRREDIAEAKFADVREGGWWVDQGKTGSRVFLPTELRLNCFGMSLEEVIRQCRTTGVLSKHLVHQTEGRSNSPAGSPIWLDTISRRFTDELTALNLEFDGKNPPTFHEIRSLAARLYKAQGNVNTQELLGHKSPETTLIYEDGRGEWVRVKVGTVSNRY